MRKVGLEPTRPFGHQILSLDPSTDPEAVQQDNSANSKELRENPQPSRKPDSPPDPTPDNERGDGGEE
jgi:hypothetical protein